MDSLHGRQPHAISALLAAALWMGALGPLGYCSHRWDGRQLSTADKCCFNIHSATALPLSFSVWHAAYLGGLDVSC